MNEIDRTMMNGLDVMSDETGHDLLKEDEADEACCLRHASVIGPTSARLEIGLGVRSHVTGSCHLVNERARVIMTQQRKY